MFAALYSQPDPRPEPPAMPQRAVDQWLRETFHRAYDLPEDAPIPEELLRLVRAASQG
ncbi:hypothetical protein [Roseomonas sp. KE0001]|uniref:hypothetical protein n=1 Tax=unclassified Roseomonas TaxID=2617492 RepID=UPI0018DF207A|nr:hypothetical protein [Roseomonas sp. KE0001]